MGISLEYLESYAEANAAFEKAIKLKPEYVEARFNKEALIRKLQGRSRCFIATAAYGTTLHPELVEIPASPAYVNHIVNKVWSVILLKKLE